MDIGNQSLQIAIKHIRDQAIEECARAVEAMYWNIVSQGSVAATIRKLKDVK